MKRILPLLLVFISFSALFSQEKITLNGQLLDAETQEALPFANVAVHNFESNILITGTITDARGRFEILEMSVGKYRLYFS